MKKFVYQTCEWDEYKVFVIMSEDRTSSCRMYVYNDEPEVAVICDLYVDKESRNQGKACAMLNGCKDIAREMGCKKMHLRSDTDDLGSSMVPANRVQGYFESGLDGGRAMKKFDPQIYPRKLYIVESYDEIMELFTNRDEDATSPPDTDGYGAITFPVIEKSTGHYGVAVYFIEDITIGRIAHEADHVVSSMWQDL